MSTTAVTCTSRNIYRYFLVGSNKTVQYTRAFGYEMVMANKVRSTSYREADI